MFVHILKVPSVDFILLPEVTKKVTAVRSFPSGHPLIWKQQQEGVFIYVEGTGFDGIDEILEVTLK
jgi:hypothetical protein